MRKKYPNKKISPLIQIQGNISEDIEKSRYNTLRPRGDHYIHQRKTQVNNKHGNPLTYLESSSQLSYEKETREKEINTREAIKVILTITRSTNSFHE